CRTSRPPRCTPSASATACWRARRTSPPATPSCSTPTASPACGARPSRWPGADRPG
ncbi:MAG: hypothetical protein AVDCRST_MAG66-2960, partial [uncultured Pseudonocardia sp.]